jgi:hypothetical protein
MCVTVDDESKRLRDGVVVCGALRCSQHVEARLMSSEGVLSLLGLRIETPVLIYSGAGLETRGETCRQKKATNRTLTKHEIVRALQETSVLNTQSSKVVLRYLPRGDSIVSLSSYRERPPRDKRAIERELIKRGAS